MLLLWLLVGAAVRLRADGFVVPEVFYPKVTIPNQQACLHFANGVEQLVIETAFVPEFSGAGRLGHFTLLYQPGCATQL